MLYVSPSGTKTWRVLFYEAGRPRSKRLGTYPALSVQNARKRAFEFDPDHALASQRAGSFKAVAEQWIIEHVDKKRLRSKREIERRLAVYVYPHWEKRPIFDLNRLEVNKLLRNIEHRHGAPQADAVLADVRGVMTWYAVQDHRYIPAVVPKMRRDKRDVQERSRKRILTDEEIRTVWKAAGELGTYGAIVKVLLLTGQRLRKVSQMRWTDIVDDVWTISSEPREKGHAGRVRLPRLVLEIIDAQPRLADSAFVFSGTQQGRPSLRNEKPKRFGLPAFNSFSQHKRLLDEKLPDGTAPWVLHDLRRTARSLMSRLAIPRDTAERTIGHTIPGVEGIYDRHSYFEEKSETLKQLAKLVGTL